MSRVLLAWRLQGRQRRTDGWLGSVGWISSPHALYSSFGFYILAFSVEFSMGVKQCGLVIKQWMFWERNVFE